MIITAGWLGEQPRWSEPWTGFSARTRPGKLALRPDPAQSPQVSYHEYMVVGSEEPELLSVRETARRLGVHENTVRNWAREGILPTARIPGSRFHRFNAQDVARLRRQRGSAVSSVEAERRTIGPDLVDGAQLSQW